MRTRTALFSGVAGLLAAGCINVTANADMAVSDDDTVSGTFELLYGLDQQTWEDAVRQEGGNPTEEDPNEIAEELRFTDEDIDGFEQELLIGRPTITVEATGETDGPFDMSGLRLTFDSTPFDDFNKLFDEMDEDEFLSSFRIARRGELHTFEGFFAAQDDEGFGDIYTVIGAEISVTFAGDVVEGDGDVDGTTVTWDRAGTYMAAAHTSDSDGGDISLDGDDDTPEEDDASEEPPNGAEAEEHNTDVANDESDDAEEVEAGEHNDVEEAGDEVATAASVEPDGMPLVAIGVALVALFGLIGGVVLALRIRAAR